MSSSDGELGCPLDSVDIAGRFAGLREDGGDWRITGANGGQRRLFELQMRGGLSNRRAQRFHAV